jgi:hypothetical protein
MANIDAVNLGHMGVNATTYSDIKQDIATSALQKEIYHGNISNAFTFACELYFGGYSMRLNVWNKLLLIAIEDVGMAEPNAVIWIYHLSKIKTALALATATVLLAGFKKTRSNYWGSKLYPEFETEIVGPIICGKVGNLDWLADQLKIALKEKNIGYSLYYSKVLFYHPSKIVDKSKMYNSNIAQIKIWEVFDNVLLNCSEFISVYYQTCKEVAMLKHFKWQKGSRLIHVHLIHMWCNHVDIRGKQLFPQTITMVEPIKEYEAALRKFVDRTTIPAQIPDYVYDMTTCVGVEMNRDIVHCLQHAFPITNEHPTYKDMTINYITHIHPKAAAVVYTKTSNNIDNSRK